MEHKSPIHWIAMILVLVGGLNWGLVGAFDFNLVNLIFGWSAIVEKIVYILVGISALFGFWMMYTKHKGAAVAAK